MSINDLKGSSATGNRGLVDLLLFKRLLKSTMLAKGIAVLGPESQRWFDGPVATHAESWSSWLKQEEAQDVSWRSGRTPAERAFIELFTEIIFGRSHDTLLKLAIKQGKQPSEALETMCIGDLWQDRSRGGGRGIRVRFKLKGWPFVIPPLDAPSFASSVLCHPSQCLVFLCPRQPFFVSQCPSWCRLFPGQVLFWCHCA